MSSKVRAIVLLKIKSNDGDYIKSWLIDFTNHNEPKITINNNNNNNNNNNKNNAYVTITCVDQTFLSLSDGSLSPEYAYMRGLMKIKGSMGVAMKVKSLLELAAKLNK